VVISALRYRIRFGISGTMQRSAVRYRYLLEYTCIGSPYHTVIQYLPPAVGQAGRADGRTDGRERASELTEWKSRRTTFMTYAWHVAALSSSSSSSAIRINYGTSFLDKFTKHVMMLANLGADNLAPHTLALSLSKITIAKPPTEPKRQKQKKLDSLAPREAAA